MGLQLCVARQTMQRPHLLLHPLVVRADDGVAASQFSGIAVGHEARLGAVLEVPVTQTGHLSRMNVLGLSLVPPEAAGLGGPSHTRSAVGVYREGKGMGKSNTYTPPNSNLDSKAAAVPGKHKETNTLGKKIKKIERGT